MWILSGFSFIFIVTKIFKGIKGFFSRKINQEINTKEKDEYNLINYKIVLDDDTEIIKYDVTTEEIDEI